MKGTKKGLALIAVLAFLITVALPISSLAAVSTTPNIIYGDASMPNSATMEIVTGAGTTANASLATALDPSSVDITLRYAWAGSTVNFYADVDAPSDPGTRQFTGTPGGQWLCAWVPFSGSVTPGTTKLNADPTWITKAVAALSQADPTTTSFTVPENSAGDELGGGTAGAWILAAVYQNPDGTYQGPLEQMMVVPCVAKLTQISGQAGFTGGTTASGTEFQMGITGWDVRQLDGTDNTPGTALIALPNGAWAQKAPPVDARTNFDWSWTGDSTGESTGTGLSNVITVDAEGKYTITCQPAANNAPWIEDGKATLAITVGANSSDGAPAAQPTAIALGQKTTLTATVPYATGDIYGWASEASPAQSPLLTANLIPTYPGSNEVPEDGQIVNEAWPTKDTYYQLTYGAPGSTATPIPAPIPQVKVSQLYAVDSTVASPVPTTGTVEIVAKAGTQVTVDAVWGAAGVTPYTEGVEPDVNLTLYQNRQQTVVDAPLSNVVTLRPDQQTDVTVELSYERDVPTEGVTQIIPGIAYNSACWNYPMPFWVYDAANKGNVLNALDGLATRAMRTATFKIRPAFLLGSIVPNDGSYPQGSTIVSGSGAKLYQPTDNYTAMQVQYSEPVTYPGQDVKDGTVEWEILSTPSKPKAGPEDQRLLASRSTTFETGGRSYGNFTPEEMGVYVIQAKANPGGSTVTFNIDVTIPADPNSILIQPSGQAHIPAGESESFTASVVNSQGLGLLPESPSGTWTITDNNGRPLYNDQVTMEGADTAHVTVTPDKNAVGATWQLRFIPDDKNIQRSKIDILVTAPRADVEIEATPQDSGSSYDLTATTDPATLTGTWSIAPSTGDNAPAAPVTLPVIADATAKETTLDPANATPGTYVVTFTTDATPQYASGTASAEVTIGVAAPVVTITVPTAPGQTGIGVETALDARSGATVGVVTLPTLTNLPAGTTATLVIAPNGTQEGQELTFDPAAANGTLTYDPASQGWMAAGSTEPIKAVQLKGFDLPINVTITGDGITFTDPDGGQTTGSAAIPYGPLPLRLPGGITAA